MPIRRTLLTAVEVTVAREACEPVLSSVTHRLLRGGFPEYLKFRQAYTKKCERAVASDKPTSTALPSTGAFQPPPPPQTRRVAAVGHRADFSSSSVSVPQISHRRINPEGLKAVFAESGVLLTSENYAAIFLAYSDPVGFVLADDLLEALHPCQQTPPALLKFVSEVMLSTLFSTLPLSCVAVTVDSVRDAFSTIFAANLSREEESAVDARTAAEQLSALAVAQADVQATFTPIVYTEGSAVPRDDVTTFIVLILQQHPCLSSLIQARCNSVASFLQLVPALASPSQGEASPLAASMSTSTNDSALFHIHHVGSTTKRKFERYEENKDRRDEWIRGREEADARPMYMRRVAGYGGHLPEYQYHFGRTFHVIEEDLPQLTKPKPPLEPVPADWYGPGVVLKDSRMNRHHYRLA